MTGLATQFNLKSCFTMAYSPESNGMAEAFVKTIKRDYVYVNNCVNPKAVFAMLPARFNDYNEISPHSVLGMLNPEKCKSFVFSRCGRRRRS